MAKLHAFGEVPHPLQPEPERLHPGLAIAFAPEKTAETGDEADDGVELGCLLGLTLLGKDVGRLPFLGREQQRGVECWCGALL